MNPQLNSPAWSLPPSDDDPGHAPMNPPASLVRLSLVRPMPPCYSVIFPNWGDQLSVGQARQAVDVMRRGGIVMFPSDCSYAVGVDPRHPAGVSALDALLDHANAPIPLTVADPALAATIIKFNANVRVLVEKFWPGGLGLHAKPASWRAAQVSRRLHAPGGAVVRMSRSVIENQLSGVAQLPITSAALRDSGGALVCDADEAFDLTIHLHQERIPYVPLVFIADRRKRPLRRHSSMISVGRKVIKPLRNDGSVDLNDAMKAVRSYNGVDWSDAT